MRKRHLSDGEILEFLIDPTPTVVSEERGARMAHFSDCDSCATRYNELAPSIANFVQPGLMDTAPSPGESRRDKLDRMLTLIRRLREEATGLDAILDETFTGAPANWKARFAALEGVHTYAMVDTLIKRTEAAFASNPAAALAMAAVAVDVADAIHISAYPFDLVISARARASLEHAFLLYYRGYMPQALLALDRSERLFRQLSLADFQIARASLVRAMIYRSLDRIPEALPLTESAAKTFASYGDQDRVNKAHLTQAAMLMNQARFAEALPICLSLEGETPLQATTDYGMVLHNVGICYREQQQFGKAEQYLARAIAEYQKHNANAEKIRSEWSLASTFVASGRVDHALPLFFAAWEKFAEIGLATDAALVALQLSEVLLAIGQPQQVPDICRKLLDHFTRNSMMSRAVTALSFLREALAIGKATPALVHSIADFIRELEKHPTIAYVPPAL